MPNQSPPTAFPAYVTLTDCGYYEAAQFDRDVCAACTVPGTPKGGAFLLENGFVGSVEKVEAEGCGRRLAVYCRACWVEFLTDMGAEVPKFLRTDEPGGKL